MSFTAMRENTSDSSSPEQSSDRETQSDEVLSEEEDDVSKETQNASTYHSDSFGQGLQNFQNGVPNILPRNDETLTHAPQPGLAAHSIACGSNLYCDPYYGGMMAAYGQPLVHPQYLDMHQARVPLTLEVAQEPVYVNAKQYHAILRRRQSRAKAELEKKLIKDRKPYLHESRHQHAMRRVRGSGGRFAKKAEVDASKHTGEDKNTTASGSAISSQSTNSSGIKRMRSDSVESLEAHQETQGGGLIDYCNARTYVIGGAEASAYHLHSSDRGEGGSLGKQWKCIPSNQASQRAVAMK